jgi:hypothetical protein
LPPFFLFLIVDCCLPLPQLFALAAADAAAAVVFVAAAVALSLWCLGTTAAAAIIFAVAVAVLLSPLQHCRHTSAIFFAAIFLLFDC